MKIVISELETKLLNILDNTSLFSPEEAKIISNQYIDAELRGKTTHGISKFCVEFHYFEERESKPKILKESSSLAIVDANKEIGQLAATFCVKLAIKKAKTSGVSIVGMFNSQRYGILDTWVRMIAEKDLVGLVVNSCEPAATVYGGTNPIMGTNPIAFSIPTNSMPIVVDMATSKIAMSTMWQAKRAGKLLPKESFFDKKGSYTVEPEEVFAVKHFNGYKGFAINLIVEFLSGSLIGAKVGLNINSFYDIGYFFQAIDPGFFQPIEKFKQQNSQLIAQIKNSRLKKGFNKIYLPGEKSEAKKRKNLKRGYIKILRSTWENLKRMEESKKDGKNGKK